MESTKRIYLKEGQIIELRDSSEKTIKYSFKILGMAGEGSTSVCYRAQRISDGLIGHLKEFYPADYSTGDKTWYYSMKRLDDGHLVCGKGFENSFRKACEEYLKGYRLLNETLAENPDSLILRNYVENCEILYSDPKDKKNNQGIIPRIADFFGDNSDNHEKYETVYIWSTGLEGETFDHYLKEVRNNPAQNPSLRLNEILNVMSTLTDALKVFHIAGLLHLDIKPGNFMVALDSEGNLNSSNISIFDIDAIYSVDSDKQRCLGTKGFRAPEMTSGKIDNRADLYSIGAVLFYAIVVSDDIPDGVYEDKYYDQIDQLVKHSKLIANSEAHTDVYLLSKLVNILKKCLAYNYRQRYSGAAELLEDLKDAEVYSSMYAISADRLGYNRKARIINIENKGINDPEIVIQKMLFEHPLFEVPPAKDGTIHALTIGCGVYGQQFIDTCLQAGQIKDHQIQITAVSNTIDDDRDVYLRFRPEITRFIDINGEKSIFNDEKLGAVRFVSLRKAAKGYTGNPTQFRTLQNESALKENRKIVSHIIQNISSKKQKLQYVFIALGNDQLNYSIAKLFSQLLSESRIGLCPVCYVSGKKRRPGKKALQMKLYPICINERITPELIDPNLEQIAFNTHLVWNGFQNDIHEVLNQFRNSRYDYESSMAFVMSLKYKLYSIGISTDDFSNAAKEFYESILSVKNTDREAQKKIQILTALEHRRWILYMVSDGWQLPRDSKGNLSLDECLRIGKAKNTFAHTHACLLSSTETAPLNSDEYQRNNREKWNNPDIDPSLDDLDKMSVKLHQMYKKRAEYLKGNNLIHENDMKLILSMIPYRDETLLKVCRQYRFCLRNILSGAGGYFKYYSEYEKKLIEEVDQSSLLSETSKIEIKNRISMIHNTMIPVIEAEKYQNYKEIDEKLIEQIPYILTYRALPSLAMAFDDGRKTDGRNEEVFGSVASASVLRPGNIRYYYLFDQRSKADQLSGKISSVLNYLQAKKIHCSVSMVIAFSGKLDSETKDTIRRTLNRMTDSSAVTESRRLHEIKYVEYIDQEHAAELILKDLNEHPALFDGSVNLFDSPRRNGAFIDRIIEAGIPYYEFDRSSQTFPICKGCEYLKYVHTDTYLRIDDMFALMNASPSGFNLPEYAEDYEKLWSIYTGCYLDFRQFENGISNWNNLTGILADYEKNREPLAVFPIIKTDSSKMIRKAYYLPAFALFTMRNILEQMIKNRVIGDNSKIYALTSDDCQAEIEADEKMHDLIRKLFSDPYLLSRCYEPTITVKKDRSGQYMIIQRRDLRVENINLDSVFQGQSERLYPLLEKLNEENFICSLRRNETDPEKVSFTYTSPRFRKLLTKAGQILEIYVYFEVLKQGYFDDAASGYELEWAEGGVSTELDLVLTKGFRSIIVECKSVRELDLDYYHKLDSISNLFGIGNTCVLIGNTYRVHDQRLAEINEMQKSRGKQLNIITVSEEQDIRNIGSILTNIMRHQEENIIDK